MAYITISTQAAQVVSGLLPAHRERTEIYRWRKEEAISTGDVRNKTYEL